MAGKEKLFLDYDQRFIQMKEQLEVLEKMHCQLKSDDSAVISTKMRVLWERFHRQVEVTMHSFEYYNNTKEESSSEEEEDDDEVIEFDDVQPVYGQEAIDLNQTVIEKLEVAFGHDAKRVSEFKSRAMSFGKGDLSALKFYQSLSDNLKSTNVGEIVTDFARLLAVDDKRLSLLEAHARCNTPQPQPSPVIITDFPPELQLEPINHLIFVIHGIGQHIDFKDGEWKSWDGSSGFEGGNHSFRNIFRSMIQSQFHEIPLNIELQSIEWHEDLHTPTGVDDIFDMIAPEGSSGIRNFNKDTLMDVLYYLSPQYGQIIVDTITSQLNQKYKIFKSEHPGWEGKISIFAHSLGSMISYDILSHEAGESSDSGITFSGIDFEVENLIAAGSPVPVMVLARGDLSVDEEKNLERAARIPSKVKRYFNIFHPIDPVAYRMEPLIKPEMRSTPAVQLPPVSHLRNTSFVKLSHLFEEITTPLHGMERLDFELRRRKREGMMEVAYAAASHSSYWENEDVVMFTLLQVCRPVIEKLRAYKSAQRPLPILSRPKVSLSPTSVVQISSSCAIRDTCTGLWCENVALLSSDDWLHLVNNGADSIACRKRSSVILNASTVAQAGDDALTLSISNTDSTTILKASSKTIRDEWVIAIGNAVRENYHNALRKTSSFTQLPSDFTIDYFGAKKVGNLAKKHKEGSWIKGFKQHWVALHSDRLDFFDTGPPDLGDLKSGLMSQHQIRACTVYVVQSSLLLRIVSKSGSSVDMRVDKSTITNWIEAVRLIHGVKVVMKSDLLDKSPCSVVVYNKDQTNNHRKSQNSSSSSVYVQGHRIMVNDKGKQYAAFVVNYNNVDSTVVVLRRFSQFQQLAKDLRQVLCAEHLPQLPHSRIWNKLDNTYLKQKSVHLQAYLERVLKCVSDDNTSGMNVLLDFLSDDTKEEHDHHSEDEEEDTE